MAVSAGQHRELTELLKIGTLYPSVFSHLRTFLKSRLLDPQNMGGEFPGMLIYH